MKSSQSVPRGLDGNNSTTSIRTSMLASLNAKDQIPDHMISAVTSECDTLVEATANLRKVWEDFKKLSSTQRGILSASNFSTLFKKHANLLAPVLHVNDAKDLFEVLDEDNDGFLNEDEQVLLFSLIKAKMLACAQKLLLVFDYKRFRELMGCVRTLETNINLYQDTLRTHIYNNEVGKYHEVGREKLDEFLDRYAVKFEQFEKQKAERLRQHEILRQDERDKLERELNSDTKMVKFKAKKELKEYLKNERLVALEERIEEATNYRKELEKISVKEATRLSNNM